MALENLRKQHSECSNYINKKWGGASANKYLKEYGNLDKEYRKIDVAYRNAIQILIDINKELEDIEVEAKLDTERAYIELQERCKYGNG